MKARLPLFFALALLVFSAFASFATVPAVHAASPALVQTDHAYSSCGTSTCSIVLSNFTSPMASGDMIIIALQEWNGYSFTISDNLTNAYSKVYVDSAGHTYTGIWYATTKGGADKVNVTGTTVPFGGNILNASVEIFEVSGVTGLVGYGNNEGHTNAPFTPNVNFGSAFFLVGSIATNRTSISPGTGFTADCMKGAFCAQYSLSGVTSPTTFPASLGVTSVWAEVGAAFGPSVSVPFGCTTNPLTLPSGTSTPTITVSGGSASPSTFTCDGSTHSIIVNPSSSYSLSNLAAASGTRFVLNSTGGTSCLTGTCAPVHLADNYQVEISNPYGLGVTRVANGTIQPSSTNGTLWADYGHAITTDAEGTNVTWARQVAPVFIYDWCNGFILIQNVSASSTTCTTSSFSWDASHARMQLFDPGAYYISDWLNGSVSILGNASKVSAPAGSIYTENGTDPQFTVEYLGTGSSEPPSPGPSSSVTTASQSLPVVAPPSTNQGNSPFLGLGMILIVLIIVAVLVLQRIEDDRPSSRNGFSTRKKRRGPHLPGFSLALSLPGTER